MLIVFCMATLIKFEDIKAWQKARFFCQEVFKIVNETSLGRDYKLRNQISAACGSIMDNIAEGFGRGGNREFIQFLEVSHGSCCECQSQLYRILDKNYISQEKFNELYDIVSEIRLMLLAFIKYLTKSTLTGPKYKWRPK